eukprot:symbB.v1.2.028100.t1/scaffold2943.1/size66754/6
MQHLKCSQPHRMETLSTEGLQPRNHRSSLLTTAGSKHRQMVLAIATAQIFRIKMQRGLWHHGIRLCTGMTWRMAGSRWKAVATCLLSLVTPQC